MFPLARMFPLAIMHNYEDNIIPSHWKSYFYLNILQNILNEFTGNFSQNSYIFLKKKKKIKRDNHIDGHDSSSQNISFSLEWKQTLTHSHSNASWINHLQFTLSWRRSLSYRNQSLLYRNQIFRTNQWNGFYIIGISVMKKLKTGPKFLMHLWNIWVIAKWRKKSGPNTFSLFGEKQSPEILCEKGVIKISQNSHKNTCAWVSFLVKLKTEKLY